MITVIYTSYFDKLNELPENIIPVSISEKPPDWYTGLQYPKLAPKNDFFSKWKQDKDNNYYASCYQKQVLDPINVYTVLKDILNLTKEIAPNLKGKTICLICDEQPNEFCHRHIVAKWLRKDGIHCEEYQFEGDDNL